MLAVSKFWREVSTPKLQVEVTAVLRQVAKNLFKRHFVVVHDVVGQVLQLLDQTCHVFFFFAGFGDRARTQNLVLAQQLANLHLLRLKGLCQIEIFPLFFRLHRDRDLCQFLYGILILLVDVSSHAILFFCRHEVLHPDFVISLFGNSLTDPLKGLELEVRNLCCQERLPFV